MKQLFISEEMIQVHPKP